MHYLRLTHPDLDFWVDVRVRESDGRWLTIADMADRPEVGMGETGEEALGRALAEFGLRIAGDLRRSAMVSLRD